MFLRRNALLSPSQPRTRKAPLICECLETRNLLSANSVGVPPGLPELNDLPPPQFFPPERLPLAVADLDLDGQDDFVLVHRETQQILVRYADGGTQLIDETHTGRLDPRAIRLMDLNDDNLLDMVVANGVGNNILIFQGQARGRFGSDALSGQAISVGELPCDVAVLAHEQVGPLLVVANQLSDDLSLLQLGRQPGEIGRLRLPVGARPSSILVADATGDALPDLLVTEETLNQIRIFIGRPEGFAEDDFRLLPVGLGPVQSLMADFTGDQLIDLVAINAFSNSLTFYADVANVFSQAEELDSGGFVPTAAVARDVNTDGITDLIVCHSGDSTLSLFLGGDTGLQFTSSQVEPGMAAGALAPPASLLDPPGVYVASESWTRFVSFADVESLAPAPQEGPPPKSPGLGALEDDHSFSPDDVSRGGSDATREWSIDLLPLRPGDLPLVPSLTLASRMAAVSSGEVGQNLLSQLFEQEGPSETVATEETDAEDPTHDPDSVTEFLLGVREMVRQQGLPTAAVPATRTDSRPADQAAFAREADATTASLRFSYVPASSAEARDLLEGEGLLDVEPVAELPVCVLDAVFASGPWAIPCGPPSPGAKQADWPTIVAWLAGSAGTLATLWSRRWRNNGLSADLPQV